MKTFREKTDKDVLTWGQRVGECISVVVMFFIFGFFVYHQVAQTGFFTDSFGPIEMICLYGPMLLSVAAPIGRAVIGRRNPARPLEVVTNVCMALGAYWLLRVFPFNFAHLADALPGGMRFVFGWVNNDIGRIPFLLPVILCPIVALVTAWIYFSSRQRESVRAASS